MTHLHNVKGRAIDLVHPIAEQVDFEAEAHALSHINRYIGHPIQSISVAHHKLIGYDLCPEPLRPHWLVHDFKESRLTDLARPVQQALRAVGDEAQPGFGEVVRRVIAEYERRHDVVIHAAAGLPMPSKAQREAIEALDQRCIVTEVRDFQAPWERPSRLAAAGVAPAKYLHRWAPPIEIAERLIERLRRHLPALRTGF